MGEFLESYTRSFAGCTPVFDSGRKKQLAAFQKTAGFRFRSLELLNLSFVHRSVSNETAASWKAPLDVPGGAKINNERLEFLGDSILGAVCATLLYQKYAGKSEGELAKIKSVAVSENILSAVARELQIDSMLLLGKGEELSGGRTKKAILADALEALIGALYLDSGYKAAFDFVSRFLSEEIDRVADTDYHRDYKSLLQELCQRFYRSYPEYHMVKRSGPEHERMFWMEVVVNGTVYGPGMGRNKKSAEQEAARLAYDALNIQPPEHSGGALP
jgi:ribonuclease-3